jgi:hypothetical protein
MTILYYLVLGMSEKKPISASKRIAIAIGIILLILVILYGALLITFLINEKNNCYCSFADNSLCTDKDIKKLSSSGDGTLENPYVIDNSTFDFVCIGGWYSRITVDFIIKNCTFTTGLEITHVNNFVI